MKKKKRVTMQDIADALGVSKVTVSKALNDKDGVGPELKEDILQKAEEFGYRLSKKSIENDQEPKNNCHFFRFINILVKRLKHIFM